MNDYENQDTVYQPDRQPSLLKFEVVREADGAGVVKHGRGALETDAMLGEVGGVLLLVPSKARSDVVPTILHVREGARQEPLFRYSRNVLGSLL